MRLLAALVIAVALSGCANPRYTSYDPCIECGEGWTFIPNERFAAQREWQRLEAKHKANQ